MALFGKKKEEKEKKELPLPPSPPKFPEMEEVKRAVSPKVEESPYLPPAQAKSKRGF